MQVCPYGILQWAIHTLNNSKCCCWQCYNQNPNLSDEEKCKQWMTSGGYSYWVLGISSSQACYDNAVQDCASKGQQYSLSVYQDPTMGCCNWKCKEKPKGWQSGDEIYEIIYYTGLDAYGKKESTINLDEYNIEGQPICLTVKRTLEFPNGFCDPDKFVYLQFYDSNNKLFTFTDKDPVTDSTYNIPGPYSYINGKPWKRNVDNQKGCKISYHMDLKFHIC